MSSLTIHHLRRSQSERVIWLCEELKLSYTLICHDRAPTLQAPESYRALHWAGTAPIIEDKTNTGTTITLAETGAIFEYILTKYANGHLTYPPGHPQYPDYVFWLHRANGSFQPALMSVMYNKLRGGSDEDRVSQMMQRRLRVNFEAMERQLGRFRYLAGDELTAADCVTAFSLTTGRLFIPYGLEEYPNIVSYLERIGKREAFRRAMEKGDPGLTPVLSAETPRETMWKL